MNFMKVIIYKCFELLNFSSKLYLDTRIVVNYFQYMKRIISFAFILFFSFFWNVDNCLAGDIKSELNKNFSEESKNNKIKNDNNEKTTIPKATNEDIFGDEQAFPFIAGLGKNAAH